jgi:CHAD domain-containing protein
MLKESICSYFKDQEESVIKNWEIAKSGHDFDALHDLRVGIKRMKSLYQVLDPMSDGNFDYKKHFEDIYT